MRRQYHLTFLIYSLGTGGAERVVTHLANYWARKHWQITILTLVDSGSQIAYPLDHRVRVIPLAIARSSRNFLEGFWNSIRRIFALRSHFRQEKPDIIISFMSTINIQALLAVKLGRVPIPVIIADRSNPHMDNIGFAWSVLRKLIYPLADFLVLQSKQHTGYFSKMMKKDKVIVIPNPVLPPHYPVANEDHLDKPAMVAAGRLVPAKGFDILIQAFSLAAAEFPDWSLYILGEGAERSGLEALILRLGLEKRVHLVGWVADPQTYFRQADIFTLPSRYEGFPNALCEAMACGLPVVATSCQGGTVDIVRDGVDGLLVVRDKHEALAEGLRELMKHPGRRREFGKNALKVVERFGIEKVSYAWEQIIGNSVK